MKKLIALVFILAVLVGCKEEDYGYTETDKFVILYTTPDEALSIKVRYIDRADLEDKYEFYGKYIEKFARDIEWEINGDIDFSIIY